MPTILFRSRLMPGVEERYALHAQRMYELARAMPGFVSSTDFVGEHGERLAVIEFASHDTLAAWRNHPEHRAAQAQGRAEYYASYVLQVLDLVRESKYTRDDAT